MEPPARGAGRQEIREAVTVGRPKKRAVAERRRTKGGTRERTSGARRTTSPKGHPRWRPSLTRDQQLDLLGLILFVAGILVALGLLAPHRMPALGPLLLGLIHGLGGGAFAFPLGLIAGGAWLLVRRSAQVPRPRPSFLLGLLLLYGSLLMALDRLGGLGGAIGAALVQGLTENLGPIGAWLVLLGMVWAGLMGTFRLSPERPLEWAIRGLRRLRSLLPDRSAGEGFSIRPPRQAEPVASPSPPDRSPRILGEAEIQEAPEAAGIAEPLEDREESEAPLQIAPEGPKWTLPRLEEILDPEEEVEIDEADLREKAHIIEETLRSLGVEARVVEVQRGPTVTLFGLEPGQISRGGRSTRVKVGQIAALADDLALALSARTVRVLAPIPGRGLVGIEVPNERAARVRLREVMESEAYRSMASPLRLPLGQTVSGEPLVADLTAMPHLLIAGATGSGKSVALNAILVSLLCTCTPDDLRLILIDPKRVELTPYNGIPHLWTPVVVEIEKVPRVLQEAMREMERRYRLFAAVGVRHIADYNRRAEERGEPRMPYLVIVVDELADLMITAPEETERRITRLAQMARATGIHLVIATQRPSVDVVTGLIKANFPARIAFAVASSVDSRVILDMPGAETLLGRGDMLFLAPDQGQPIRAQGCFVSDEEIRRIVTYWKGIRGLPRPAPGRERQGALPTPPSARSKPEEATASRAPVPAGERTGEVEEEPDEVLLQRAIEVVRLHRRASISLLQRKLRIGYNRAARLIDLMEARGLIGPPEEGSRWRGLEGLNSSSGAPSD
ncbi:DNA translocase SpoIIIE [Candidatus Thermoflexus japonica]|uniref:DNA translocase SpoIIIE n=1 Tax=Candidatus Thermoflexus japonica TaxID=2035417 RepID=A0A2H5Y6M5_9CHLR|nr:DNA translocase SpoIIIE [Candidatus Thermoflexus japonica]